MSYSISLSKRLESIGAREGTKLYVESGEKKYTGTLMPHHEFSDSDAIVIKISNGYNIGVRINDNSVIKVLEQPIEHVKREFHAEYKNGLPNISLISTGGTIASFVDYRTGAVQPALSASELVNAVPELREKANITAKVLFSIFSENMSVEHWQQLAKAVADEVNNGADAVIIPHGTDTMGYTSAALSFMMGDLPVPVVLVGAQKSSDRPSSDASSNLIAAVNFCIKGDQAGVFVVMHDTLGDDSFAVHIGTRVRKMHTSRRDAFKSINQLPAARLDRYGKIETFVKIGNKTDGKTTVRSDMERAVVLLQYYPGMDPALFEDIIMKSKGVVIAGSGLGHVSEKMIPLLRKACDKGTVVVATSQCLGGRTNLDIYSTGRDMRSAGVITVLDMLPETAYVKLMWALANSKDIAEAKKMMATPYAGEMSDRRTVDV